MQVEILTRKINDKGNYATITYRDVRNGQEGKASFFMEQNNVPSQANKFCIPGKRADIEMKLKRGSPIPDKPGEFWPDKDMVESASPVDASDAAEPFHDDKPETYQQGAVRDAPANIPIDPTRESIEKQTALKCATDLGVAYMNAVGSEQFDINLVTKWQEDLYQHLGRVKR